MRLDDRALPGVHAFALRAGPSCLVRCELEAGQIAGIAPTWVRLRAVAGGSGAALRCSIPMIEEGERLRARVVDVSGGEVSAAITRDTVGEAATVPLHDDGVDLDRGTDAVGFRLAPRPSTSGEATILFE